MTLYYCQQLIITFKCKLLLSSLDRYFCTDMGIKDSKKNVNKTYTFTFSY